MASSAATSCSRADDRSGRCLQCRTYERVGDRPEGRRRLQAFGQDEGEAVHRVSGTGIDEDCRWRTQPVPTRDQPSSWRNVVPTAEEPRSARGARSPRHSFERERTPVIVELNQVLATARDGVIDPPPAFRSGPPTADRSQPPGPRSLVKASGACTQQARRDGAAIVRAPNRSCAASVCQSITFGWASFSISHSLRSPPRRLVLTINAQRVVRRGRSETNCAQPNPPVRIGA